MIADRQFPVFSKTVLTLNCKEGYQLNGDTQITCTKDTQFEFSTEPECGERQTKFKLCYIQFKL